MSTHPTFDRNPKGNFNPDNAYSQVVIGTGSLLLEDELNEMQAIMSHRLGQVADRSGTELDGVISDLYFKSHPTREDQIILPAITAKVAGHILQVSGVGNDGTTPGVEPAQNILTYPASVRPSHPYPVGFVFLEIKEQVIAGNPIDPRYDKETARRLQIQSQLRFVATVEGVSTTNFVTAFNSLTDLEGGAYTYETNGRWRSANGCLAVPVLLLISSGRAFPSNLYLPLPQLAVTYNEQGDISTVKQTYGGILLTQVTIDYYESGDINTVTSVQADGRVEKIAISYTTDSMFYKTFQDPLEGRE